MDITEEGHAQGPNQLSVLVTEAMKDAHAKSVTVRGGPLIAMCI